MKFKFIGNAGGIFTGSSGTRILCDPWIVDGVFEDSWYHYPPLKTKFSDGVKNLKNLENNQEKIEKVAKELQKKIEPVPSNNKSIDQLKFSTQKKEKLIIEDKPLVDKTRSVLKAFKPA